MLLNTRKKNLKKKRLPGTIFIFCGTFFLSLNSKDVHVIASALKRRISILVPSTWYLHFSGMICSLSMQKIKILAPVLNKKSYNGHSVSARSQLLV